MEISRSSKSKWDVWNVCWNYVDFMQHILCSIFYAAYFMQHILCSVCWMYGVHVKSIEHTMTVWPDMLNNCSKCRTLIQYAQHSLHIYSQHSRHTPNKLEDLLHWHTQISKKSCMSNSCIFSNFFIDGNQLLNRYW